jgi:tetratricopeptide (TPR) repeat protein
MKKLLIPSLILVAMAVGAVDPIQAGAEGRVAGTVEDSEGNPLVGVQITVQAIDYDFETSRTTNKKGRFTLLVMDATKDYTIRLELEGFVPIGEPFDPPLGDTLRRTWTMMPGAGGGGGAESMPTGEVQGPSATDAKGAVGRKYQQGMDAFQVDDLEQARISFTEVVELQPDLPEGHVALALVLVRLEAYDESLAQAEQALELRPGDVPSLKIKYESYKGLGNQEMVEVMLDELIVASPDEDLARLVFNSAVSKIQSGDLAGGAARLEQVRDIAPHLMPVYSALSRVYFDLQRYEESAAMANEFLAKEPGSGDVLGVLYLAYDKMGMTAEAEEVFEALKGADSHSVVRVMEEMGVANFNAGNMAQAKDLFERILEIEPDHGRAHYHLGLCYVSMGDSARGKEMLTRFVELAPSDPDAAVAQEMIATL